MACSRPQRPSQSDSCISAPTAHCAKPAAPTRTAPWRGANGNTAGRTLPKHPDPLFQQTQRPQISNNTLPHLRGVRNPLHQIGGLRWYPLKRWRQRNPAPTTVAAFGAALNDFQLRRPRNRPLPRPPIAVYLPLSEVSFPQRYPRCWENRSNPPRSRSELKKFRFPIRGNLLHAALSAPNPFLGTPSTRGLKAHMGLDIAHRHVESCCGAYGLGLCDVA